MCVGGGGCGGGGGGGGGREPDVLIYPPHYDKLFLFLLLPAKVFIQTC